MREPPDAGGRTTPDEAHIADEAAITNEADDLPDHEPPTDDGARLAVEDPEVSEDEDVEEPGVAGPSEEELYEELYIQARLKKRQLRKFPSLIRASFRLVWDAAPRELITTIVLQSIAGAAAGLVLLAGKQAFEAVLAADSVGAGFTSVLPQLLLVGVVTAVMRITQAIVTARQQMLTMLVGRRAIDQVLNVACAVDLAEFERPAFYDKLKRAEMNAEMRPFQMVMGLVGLLSSSLGLIGISVALLTIQPALLPLVVTAYVPIWLARTRTSRDMYAHVGSLTANNRERYYLRTVLTGRDEAKEVRAFDLAPLLRRRYDNLYNHFIEQYRNVMRRYVQLTLLANLGTILLTGGVLTLLLVMLLAGRIDIAAAGAAIAAVQMLGTRLSGVLESGGTLYETALFLDDYVSFVEMQPEIEQARPTGTAPSSFRDLRVENVTFTYPGSTRPALRDVSMTMQAGEIIALVGENGSGKTTLAKLLAALYPPTSGKILWDGLDTADMNPTDLRKAVALIFQDFVRYKLPARENIGVGRHERFEDLDAITAASQQVGADTFLRRLPEGYDTILAKEFRGGRDLSIGQWQRVALARAFFRDAPFVVLDEPTAALDPRAERNLFDSIRTVCRGRAVLLISHRFSSVRTADRIYVLKDGRVAETGTHAQLMRHGGLYAELFTLQASAYLGEGHEHSSPLGG